MKLLKEQIDKMQEYYDMYKNNLYAGNSDEKRSALGQFYTPAELGSRMLEKYDCNLSEFREKTILDPTMGSGLLLLYSLIAGADPERVFGIELDTSVLELGQDRLCNIGIEVPVVDYTNPENPKAVYNDDGTVKTKTVKVPKDNLHHGNALNSDCYCFPFSKYETDIRAKGKNYYKFDPNVGETGKVDFAPVVKNGGVIKSSFTFGGL